MKFDLQAMFSAPRRPARTAIDKAVQKAFRRTSLEGKKIANREVVRPLRKLMRRRRDFSYDNPLLYPQFVTKKFRKLLQARRTFRGNRFEKTANGYQQWILRVKVWTPLANILFNRREHPPLHLPFDRYRAELGRKILDIGHRELKKQLFPEVKAQMDHAILKNLSGK